MKTETKTVWYIITDTCGALFSGMLKRKSIAIQDYKHFRKVYPSKQFKILKRTKTTTTTEEDVTP